MHKVSIKCLKLQLVSQAEAETAFPDFQFSSKVNLLKIYHVPVMPGSEDIEEGTNKRKSPFQGS